MTPCNVALLKRSIAGPVREHFPLSPLTTFGVGGSADVCIWPASTQDLVTLVKMKEDTSLNIIGGGSNLIISDGDIKGFVLCTKYLSSFSLFRKNNEVDIEVGTGVSLGVLVSFGLRYGFSGMEFGIGIPGTVGGAIIGNAGVQGETVSDVIQWVEVVDESGEVLRFKKEELPWGYRRSVLQERNYIVTACGLRLQAKDPYWVKEKADNFLQKRKSQPRGFKSAGCIFKNPDGESAGKLLDECGCKGLRVGGAIVSEAHANFILNMGDAKAADIWALIEECRRRVFEKTGYVLELEVRGF
ncbi:MULTISPECIES: UDP-N-acetylmuramate dehydrogenase [Aminobacterium]|jgi:UDP-N-acetylmuramate dehydrogenase|uniref:UDP-N-acetylenolpyruvoylglucosamine reductase n=1 Tax=Aminobacterium colombiense (strain DSM 12261 / ALA-1) TaxID=572547 RepID=D5EEH2_AMICL|nr:MULTISPECIES: UDP-N-acetylmuramate dehydrogenase [Aminobacterium]MDD2378828.1 UDP-N-acetylmuramate dehydrogenase [Aminobacterium colombiense]ADE56954.1 UDP-N-acetylenolpyruvoylglucosamine reductase [Aminobacterium colombiense DSM 12261]MDD3767630.1 UDP-N-acetylmuramate dehydrogenase [Aminobacterium colombiense]MDD4265381.1 UDP-N-acetylmuramate dehydrogenase [Aminobacterium colombiense]MDD4585653.1 UDP-N-acetylmuramate dehydrogenase [Aminobacterium colombiense]